MLLPRPPREGEEKGEGGPPEVLPPTLPLPAWGEGNSYSRTAIIFGLRLILFLLSTWLAHFNVGHAPRRSGPFHKLPERFNGAILKLHS